MAAHNGRDGRLIFFIDSLNPCGDTRVASVAGTKNCLAARGGISNSPVLCTAARILLRIIKHLYVSQSKRTVLPPAA